MNLETRQNQEPSEKENLWKKEKIRIDGMTDQLNRPIDEGIKEIVIVFNVLGIHTVGSCEGHHEDKNKNVQQAPWIRIGSEKVDKIRKKYEEFKESFLKKRSVVDDELRAEQYKMFEKIQKENLKEIQKIIRFLDEFYQDRFSQPGLRLIVTHGWDPGVVIGQGALFQKIRSPEEQKEKLEAYQDEMRAFTEFLKQKYFQE